jgi:muramoyltetrapeptide carboxypeptidase
MNTTRFSFINSRFGLYNFLFLFFILQSYNSQANTQMITPAILQKEIPLPFWLQPENIDDNLKPAIDLLHSWG